MATNFNEMFGGSHKLLWIVRILFFAMSISIGTDALIYGMEANSSTVQFALGIGTFFITILFAIGVITLDAMTKNKEITTLSAVYFGLLLGFLIGSLFWAALQPILHEYLNIASLQGSGVRVEKLAQLLITMFSCYVAVSTLLQTKDEFRFIIPYVEFSKQLKGARPLVLDTSVIIDGRIADICDTGIIDTKLVVPRFVLQELQGIADSSDKIKRNRGRRGLDVLKRMQANTKIELQMHEANLPEVRGVQKVDDRLVELAKALSGRVVTNDFNLNKVAQLHGVEVVNLNELANSLKVVALPGEQLHVKIVKKGDQAGQGIGYRDDGTMIVVELGSNAIGQDVVVTVTSVLQTNAGRMIFGRMGASSGSGDHPALPPGK